MTREDRIQSGIDSYKDNIFSIEQFLKRIYNFFSDHPELNEGLLPIIHSIKYRLKSEEHLVEKINRKWEMYDGIDSFNIFDVITDIAGVRILHLYQAQFPKIHQEILNQIDEKEWYFFESPKAYTWDPESKAFYQGLNINCEVKDTFYTSIHYIVKPRENSPIKCEIQVRTLFEEIWGEIDHFLNYPNQTQSIACREQLRVLAKLSSTGTRLADSIFLSHEEYEKSG